MSNTAVLAQQVYRQAQELPEESLQELVKFIEFLRFKTQSPPTESQPLSTYQIRKLEGILEGYDFSPEMLAEARREMWRKFEDIQS